MNAPEPYLAAHPTVTRMRLFHRDLVEIRHELHRHPELGFEEHFTAELVARELTRYGVDAVHRGVGRTGVVAVIRGRTDTSGRRIGLRADMDALPIAEENRFEHRSTHAGVMHACGHDGHTTMLLGAARYLAQSPEFNGTVDATYITGIGDVQTGDTTRMLILMDIERLMQSPDMGLTDIG